MTYPNKGKTNNTFSFMRIRPTYTIKNPFFIGLCFKNMYTPMCLHSHTYKKKPRKTDTSKCWQGRGVTRALTLLVGGYVGTATLNNCLSVSTKAEHIVHPVTQ